MGLQLNMNKAYDPVGWQFLEATIRKLVWKR